MHTVKICNIKHCIENVLNMEQRINQVVALGSHPALFILAVSLLQCVVYFECVMHILHQESHPGSRRP